MRSTHNWEDMASNLAVGGWSRHLPEVSRAHLYMASLRRAMHNTHASSHGPRTAIKLQSNARPYDDEVWCSTLDTVSDKIRLASSHNKLWLKKRICNVLSRTMKNTVFTSRLISHSFLMQYLGFRDARFFLPFLWIRADGLIPTRTWFLRRFRLAFPSSAFSGHSLHAGGAISLATAGVLPAQNQAVTGHWSSSAAFGSILPLFRLCFFMAAHLCHLLFLLFLLSLPLIAQLPVSTIISLSLSQIWFLGISKGGLCGSERVFTTLFSGSLALYIESTFVVVALPALVLAPHRIHVW